MLEQLTFTAIPDFPMVEAGDDLAAIILRTLARANLDMVTGDVLVVGQKVVSKAEGRYVDLRKVTPSERAVSLARATEKDAREVEVLLSESRTILRTRPGLIIVEHRLGFICANAGLDHSNVSGPDGNTRDWVLLLPEDPDASAGRLRRRIQEATDVSPGVLIIDSHGRAWRLGTVGVAIGAAGFPALLDLRGRPDLFGDPLRITQVGLADEIAAGASALMGQANEGRPVIHVRGLPYTLREGSIREILRPEEQDLFR